MSNCLAFRTQIASIMEVLANAAAAEICKLVDDGYAVVRSELSQNQKENRALKRKVQTLELRLARDRAERTMRERLISSRGGSAKTQERSKASKGKDTYEGAYSLMRENGFDGHDGDVWRDEHQIRSSHLVGQTAALEKITEVEGEGPVPVLVKQELNEDQRMDSKRGHVTVSNGSDAQRVTSDPQTDQQRNRKAVLETIDLVAEPALVKIERAVEAPCTISVCAISDINAVSPPSRANKESTVRRFSHCVLNPMVTENKEPNSCDLKVETEDTESEHFELNGLISEDGRWSGAGEWGAIGESDITLPKMTENDGNRPEDLEDTAAEKVFKLQTEHMKPNTPIKGNGLDQLSQKMDCSMEWVINADTDCMSSSSSYMQPGSLLSQSSLTGPCNRVSLSSLGAQTWQPDSLIDHVSDHAPDTHVMARTTSHAQCLPGTSGANGWNTGSKDMSPEPEAVPKKPFFCSFCGRPFRFPKQVEIHQRVHTGEKPFSCTLCQASFTTAGNLKRHHRVHTGEKPFSCPQCEKRFSLHHQLKKHLRFHSGERPFSCSYCGKKFAEKSYLRLHLQKSHAVLM